MEYPSAKLGAVTRIYNEVSELIEDENFDYDVVKEKLTRYDDRLNVFLNSCEEQLNKPEATEVEIVELKEWMDERLIKVTDLRLIVKNKLDGRKYKVQRDNIEENASIRTGRSNISGSSISSARIKLLERKARLEAEKLTQAEKEKIEEAKIRLAQKLEDDQIRQRREIKEKERILDRQLKDIEHKTSQYEHKILGEELYKLDNNSDDQMICLDKKINFGRSSSSQEPYTEIVNPEDKFIQDDDIFNMKIPKNKNSLENMEVNKTNNDNLEKILNTQNKISMALLKNQRSDLLPRNEPIIFDGSDLTSFQSFLNSFERMIVSRCDDEMDKYYFLERYTRGHPQTLVRSCNSYNPNIAYKKAMQLLIKHYGNKYRVAQAYIERLKNWPSIRSEDGKSLEELAIFLTSCLSMVENVDELSQLNSAHEIMLVIKKLPFDMRKAWRLKVNALIENGKTVNFSHLENFVSTYAKTLNLPVFGDIQDRKGSNPSVIGGRIKKGSFITSIEKYDLHCICCKKSNHRLSECIFFKRRNYDEKLELIKRNNLCFACLEKGHRSSSCKKRKECEKCKGKHPTCLHQEKDLSKKFSSSMNNETSVSISKVNENEVDENIGENKIIQSCNTKAYISDNVGRKEMNNKILCACVPVKIKINGSNEYINTYLGLDTFATDCFIKKELLERLNMRGEKTKINLTTLNQKDRTLNTEVFEKLEIFNLKGDFKYIIQKIYAQISWPFSLEDSPKREDVLEFDAVKKLPLEFIKEEIGILVGINESELLKPLEIIELNPGKLYASKHVFGWALNGEINRSKEKLVKCNYTQKEDLEAKIEKFYAQDFNEEQMDNKKVSYEDGLWLKKVQNSIRKGLDGRYTLPLPLKNDEYEFPSNYQQVLGRLLALKKRFRNDEKFFKEYKDFLENMIKENFLEMVPQKELDVKSKVWYLAHHAVYHKQKGKIRIVFDCSLKNAGISLNNQLLQGPDLTNNLLGILIRFRENKIAFMADIEKMFFQVRVPKYHSDLMRILWFKDGDFNNSIIQYRITSHVFGAISSPSCANFALRQTALDNERDFDEDIRKLITHNFYVDDLMKSVDSIDEAKRLIMGIRTLLKKGGFNLISFVSNSHEVLKELPKNILSKNITSLDFDTEKLPNDRALGVSWLVEQDSFGFKINLRNRPFTRRGVLATMFSVYDPMGLVGPVIISAKLIFREACHLRLDWDDLLPDSLSRQWKRWIENIPQLENFKIPRCVSPSFQYNSVELHTFCDGSSKAYGAASYIRFIGKDEQIYCSLYLAKARLAPIKNTTLKTIPRIELNSAKIAVGIFLTLQCETDLEFERIYFWSDSCVVLRYIKSESTRFHRFLANRVAYIRSKTEKEQWRYVPSRLNVADVISRGSNVEDFINYRQWINGPDFLWKKDNHWPTGGNPENETGYEQEIIEEKRIMKIYVKSAIQNSITKLLGSASSWNKILKRVAVMLRLKNGLKNKIWITTEFSVDELKDAEVAIWKHVQNGCYEEELNMLKSKNFVKQSNILAKLCPWIDQMGIIRVGGRLKNSNESDYIKHPIVLPGKNPIVELLARKCHFDCGHMGRNYILSVLREKYWIIGSSSLMKKITRECIGCRKRLGRVSDQIMAPLPFQRTITGGAPFFCTGIDFFGPFWVTMGRSRKCEKRYGVMFTCLSTRATHLEVSHSVDTSSFINALRRFLSRRGQVNTIYSDNGTNLVGGCRELKESMDKWNKNQINDWCTQKHINWIFHPPKASHFGGIWERQIRTVRKILQALLDDQPHKLNNESLLTLMNEVESIMNDRPLTSISSDPQDLRPITPNNLLLLQTDQPLPPGYFNESELQIRNHWKRVQYIADSFGIDGERNICVNCRRDKNGCVQNEISKLMIWYWSLISHCLVTSGIWDV